MSRITLIAAIARNGAIGVDGDMVYHIGPDLKHFKALTTGKPVVMGRRTFESLPGGALPNRRNIVITSQSGYSAAGIETAPDLESALAMAADADEVMIIGGARVYAEAMPMAQTLELTLIDDTPARADTFFPDIDPAVWSIMEQSDPLTDARTGVSFRFTTLQRAD